MSDLSLILAAMLSLTPPEYRPVPGSDRMVEYEAFAQDIFNATHSPQKGLPFDGPAAVEASELAMVAIAANESSFNPKVRDCRKKGDGGRSISAYQLMRGPARQGYSEKEICEDHDLAAKLALNVFAMYATAGTVKRMFNGYATGSPDHSSSGGDQQNRSFEKLLRENQIALTRVPASARLSAVSTSPVVVTFQNVTRTRSHRLAY